MSKEEDILAAFKWATQNLGPVHVFVNSAGDCFVSSFYDGKTEDWKRLLDTDLLGLSIATREAIRSMKENNIDGHIVYMNAIDGHYVLDEPLNMYYGVKHAVTALTEVLRRELVKMASRIRVTVKENAFALLLTIVILFKLPEHFARSG